MTIHAIKSFLTMLFLLGSIVFSFCQKQEVLFSFGYNPANIVGGTR